MRDKRIVAEHRGGLLGKEHHRQLMKWAIECSSHVLPLFGKTVDERLLYALRVGEDWRQGNAPVGQAQKASLGAHAVAREQTDPVAVAVARSVGQAVATAHMADHSLGAALYALKAVAASGGSMDDERSWQDKQLPEDVRELVFSFRSTRKGLQRYWPNI
ncbi:MAG TPA: hypothetical protein V6C97_05125 [Oculatellaceae cyanobacterium]